MQAVSSIFYVKLYENNKTLRVCYGERTKTTYLEAGSGLLLKFHNAAY